MTRLSTQIYLDYFCIALTHFSVVLKCLPVLSWVMNVNRSPTTRRAYKEGISLLWDEKNLIKFSWKVLDFMLLPLIVFHSHIWPKLLQVFLGISFAPSSLNEALENTPKKRWIIEKLLFYFSVNSHLLLFFFLFLLWRLVVHSWGKWMCHDDAIICNYSFPPVILMIVCFSIFLSRESNLRSSWNVYAGIVK